MVAFVNKIQKIPTKTRTIAFGALIVVILIVYVIQFQIPMRTKLETLEKSMVDLQGKARENDTKIKQLDKLKLDVKALKAQLIVLTQQLPPESEVSGLLKQIQTLVNQSGLILKLWKPDKRRTHASGLYDEIPISLTLSGGYHNTGAFFDRVGNLTRIVNMYNIKMGNAKMSRDGAVEMDINCTAMTFSAAEKKVEEATPAKKPQQQQK